MNTYLILLHFYYFKSCIFAMHILPIPGHRLPSAQLLQCALIALRITFDKTFNFCFAKLVHLENELKRLPVTSSNTGPTELIFQDAVL